SRLGARRVVGVDLSPGSLRRARLLAERAGAAIEYVEANVYDAREAVEGAFDLVYTSLGVLCWLPDVTAWAQVVASLLRPGGRFLIRDDHPMFMTVGEDVSDGLRIEQPYFQRPEPMTWDEAGSYVQSPQDAPAFENGVNHQWNHSVGEILTALLEAGLVLDSFEESPYSAWQPWPELMMADGQGYRLGAAPDRHTLQLVLTAHRPRGAGPSEQDRGELADLADAGGGVGAARGLVEVGDVEGDLRGVVAARQLHQPRHGRPAQSAASA